MRGLRLVVIALLFGMGLFTGCSSDSSSPSGGGTDELPDLEFSSLYSGFATTVEQGQNIAIRRSYRDNNGSGGGEEMLAAPVVMADIGPFDISYYFSIDETLDTGADILMSPVEEVPGLASGWETSVSDYLLFIPADMPAGSYSVFGMIDSGEDIDETDESNNTGAFSVGQYIHVIESAGGKPDLGVVTGAYQSEVTQGQQAGAELTVTNRGVVSSAMSCTGRLYMSDDNQYDAGDHLLVASGFTIWPLSVGQGQKFYINYIVPDTYSGAANLLFLVDADDEIDESVENDNVYQMMITVNVP